MLLGVSRMTIYRYVYIVFIMSVVHNCKIYASQLYCPCRRRLEYGLTTDPNAVVSDQELISMIRLIRQDNLYSGVSMICGSLRARGMKVTRERVRQSLRSIDPIGVALRWPAGTTR